MKTLATILSTIAVAVSLAIVDVEKAPAEGARAHVPTLEMEAPQPADVSAKTVAPAETADPFKTARPVDPVTLIGHTEHQAGLVYETVERFTDAGLELPPVTVRFSPDLRDCNHYTGLYYRETHTIIVCHPSEFVITHELAHAWEAHTLTDAERAAYTEYWEAPTWESHDYEWETRGIERAANTVAWALLLDNPRPYEPFHSHLCSYEMLTGNPLTQTLAAPCPTP